MFSSNIPDTYNFNNRRTIEETQFLSCKSFVLPQQIITRSNDLTCTTNILPNINHTIYNPMSNMYMTQDNIINTGHMNSNSCGSPSLSVHMSHENIPHSGSIYSNLLPQGNMNITSENINIAFNSTPNKPHINDIVNSDPGVVAVSKALFACNRAFQSIPIKATPAVFRKREKGEPNSEWSNAFVTKIDPCACGNVEEEFEQYDVTKFVEEGQVKTVFNFGYENNHNTQ